MPPAAPNPSQSAGASLRETVQDLRWLGPVPEVPAEAEPALRAYAALLLEWNRHINLSGAHDADTLWHRHLRDCLSLLAVPRPASALRVVDIGSGAGLPGLPWAVLHPQDTVVTLDSVAKKITFQQVAGGRLGLENLHPTRADAGAFGATLTEATRFDLALARALAPLPQLAALAAPLLHEGGVLWAMKGRRVSAELAEFDRLPSAEKARWQTTPVVYGYATDDAGGEAAIVELRRSAN